MYLKRGKHLRVTLGLARENGEPLLSEFARRHGVEEQVHSVINKEQLVGDCPGNLLQWRHAVDWVHPFL